MISRTCPCGASLTVGRLRDAHDPVAESIADTWLQGHARLHENEKAPRSDEQPTRAAGDRSHPDRPSQTDGSNQ